MTILKTLAVASAVTLLAGAAQAATVNCGDDVSMLVMENAGCQYNVDISNDSPEGQFLAGNWFGSTDWDFLAKDDPLGNDGVLENGSGLQLSQKDVDDAEDLDLSGIWTILNYDAAYDYMLVLKGANSADPAGLVAYLLVGDTGMYETTFFGNQGQRQEISHVSLYKRMGDVPPIPLPAAGWLLLGGLGGLAAMKRRRKS